MISTMVNKQITNRIFGNIDISDPEILEQNPNRRRRSPIMISIDDPKISPVDVYKMMEIGLNAVRFKASHSTHRDKLRLLGVIDKAAAFLSNKHAILDWPVATCVELKTSIVKTGILEQGEGYITITEGTEVTLTCNTEEFDKCNAERIFVDNPTLAADIKPGNELSIEHDEVIVRCKEVIDNNSISCVVTKAGRLASLCIVCARGAKTTRPFITKKDLEIVKFALKYQVDVLIINYVRSVETIRKIKDFIGCTVKRPVLLCGICTGEGLENFDDVLKECDGIVFSREFLAYELDSQTRQGMLKIQKWVGAKCQQAGKPFYISGGIFGQALATGNFVDNETSDVANALLDGATGFVLVNCPRVEYVLDVINALNELCCSVEPFCQGKDAFWRIISEIKMPVNAAEACAISCATIANQSHASIVVIPTVTGRTAKTLMWLQPSCLIITVSKNTSALRLLTTYRCIVPLMYKGGPQKNWYTAMEARVNFAVEFAVKRGWVIYGDTYVTLQRASEDSAFCDCVRVWTVSMSKKSTVECPG